MRIGMKGVLAGSVATGLSAGLAMGVLLVPGIASGQQSLPVVDATPTDMGQCRSPTSHAGTNRVLNCICPAAAGDPNHSGSVWGTDIYTADSYTCKAARHAGVITSAGGDVVLQMLPGQASYVGSERNGEVTRSYGRYGASYRFVRLAGAGGGSSLGKGIGSAERRYSEVEKVGKLGGVLGAIGRGSVNNLGGVSAGQRTGGGSSAGAINLGTCTSVPPAYRLKAGSLLSCQCPASPPEKSPIWGTGVYSNDSYICKAAIHGGAMTRVGGIVTFEVLPDQASYTGSLRNGVKSMAYGRSRNLGAYRFVK